MGTSNTRFDDAQPASRFSYHTEIEPEEGGVRSVTAPKPPQQRPSAGSGGTAAVSAASGAPGPAERLLDISELVRSIGMRYTHRFDIPPHPADFVEYVAPLVGEITLSNTGAVLLARGRVQTTVRMECGRCLAPTDENVETDLEEEFDIVAKRNAFNQEEAHAVDEDTPASVIEGNVLNLGELLRQNVLLAAPSQPLCGEECAGLPNPAADTSEAEPLVADGPLKRLAELLAQHDDEQAADKKI
jgi:uncharacterized protein